MVPDSSAATGHRTDEHRSAQAGAEEICRQLDGPEVGLRERVVRQPIALQAGGHRLEVDGLAQAHVDVSSFAGFHKAAGAPGRRSHRLPLLRQWRGDRICRNWFVDRDRGHRRICSSPRSSWGWCGIGADGSACRLQTPPLLSTAPAAIPPRQTSRSRSLRLLLSRSNGSIPAGCPPSAMMPPSRATHRSGLSPTYSCPSRR